MKFILKGKEFLSKKLQQLEIASDGFDLISQQIPARLKQPLKVLQSNQLDLESNDAYETYFKSYPNHHISHYLLEKYNMAAETNALPPPYKMSGSNEDPFIPQSNKELERKALLLKEVVDEYDEGYHKIDDAILCMAVIHFHHKRGTEIEYRYPQTKSVEDIENLIVHHAMPDSSHNKMEDYNFFNFQATVKGRRRMLFGVSYFKQIKVTESMKKNNSEITRSYMQKALAVVSTLPLFGYLKLRLASTIKVFFADFNNYELITAAYKDLNKNVSESWPKLDMSQLYIGSDLRAIIQLFGAQDFYEIWKAVLYQKRVVIFAHSSSSASSFILSLLTLFPGLSTFGLYSRPISKYMQSLREFALPLKTFSSDNFMSMSFHIQDFHQLNRFQKSNKGSFLLGTTNRLLKEANDYGIEMLINLEDCTIEKKKARVNWEPLSRVEKSFIARIDSIIKIEKGMEYQGSEDMIRNDFHSFLKHQLSGIIRASQKLREWTKRMKEYEKNSKDSRNKDSHKEKEGNYQLMMEEGEEEAPSRKQSDDFPPLIPSEVSNIPLPGLLLAKSFPYFLQFHNEKIPDIFDSKIIPCLIIENYEYSLKLPDEYFVMYNWLDNKLLFGKGRPSAFEGKEIKFYSENREDLVAKYVYVGSVEKFKFCRNGFYIDKNQLYEGEYEAGVKEGYGKLTNSVHKYIGNFRNNLYDGDGQLVMGQDIYVGEFREGMRNGSGRNQGELDYDGEWLNNKPEGSGILKVAGNEFMGKFTKGKLNEELDYTIKFENGSLFKGKVRDMKPEGKGYQIDGNGTRMVEYKNGEIVREISEEEEENDENKTQSSQTKEVEGKAEGEKTEPNSQAKGVKETEDTSKDEKESEVKEKKEEEEKKEKVEEEGKQSELLQQTQQVPSDLTQPKETLKVEAQGQGKQESSEQK